MRCGRRQSRVFTKPFDRLEAPSLSSINTSAPICSKREHQIQRVHDLALIPYLFADSLTCDEAPEEPATTKVDRVLKLDCNISIETNHMMSGIKDVSRTSYVVCDSGTNRRSCSVSSEL